jgi:hypothetical protein
MTFEQKTLIRAQSDPVWWCENILGVKTLSWQGHRDILSAFTQYDRISVKSGHSMGKDFISGMVSLWFLYCFPQSVVITTAPTARQVEKIVWGEISKYHKASRVPLAGKLNTKDIKIAEDWYALGFTTTDKEELGKFQGIKGKNILVVVTEAQAVEVGIFDQIEGITTADNSKIYLAGNALVTDGEFYKSFSPKSGYKNFSFSCYDSPNYIAGKEIIPGMVGHKWVEDKEKRWGKDSPLFQSRVMAEFPLISIDTLLSLPLLMACVNREGIPELGYVGAGADIARYGDCETVFKAVKGKKEICSEAKSGLSIPDNARELLSFCDRVGANKVSIDDTGVGGGVTDIVQQTIRDNKLKLEVEGVIVGRPAFNCKDFANLRAELFWEIRNKVIAGDCSIIDCPDTIGQLSNIKYHFDGKGRIIMESKDDMRRRGLSSPDHADALMLAFYAASLNWKPATPPPEPKDDILVRSRAIYNDNHGIRQPRKVKEYANFR